MRVVIDASIALAWALPDESDGRAIAAYAAVEEDGAIAPVLFKIEVANALTIAARRGRITTEQRMRAIEATNDIGIVFDLEGLDTSWTTVPNLADRHKLSIYDALYLDVALRRGLPLATLDKALAAAALREDVKLV